MGPVHARSTAQRTIRRMSTGARFVTPMKNVEWVSAAFHQMGAFKWKAIGLDYKHDDTRYQAQNWSNGLSDPFRPPAVTRIVTGIRSGETTCWTLLARLSKANSDFWPSDSGYLVGQSTSSASRLASARFFCRPRHRHIHQLDPRADRTDRSDHVSLRDQYPL